MFWDTQEIVQSALTVNDHARLSIMSHYNGAVPMPQRDATFLRNSLNSLSCVSIALVIASVPAHDWGMGGTGLE